MAGVQRLQFLPTFFIPYLLLLNAHLATSVSFAYPNFNAIPGDILCQGHAAFLDSSIHLTSAGRPNSFGRAVYADAIPVWDSLSRNLTSFSTSFSFVIGADDGTDGLAFFLSPNPIEPLADATSGTYLALFNGTLDEIRPSKIIAVEFDSSGDPPTSAAAAPNFDNGGIAINNFSVTTVTLNTSINQGLTANARIGYDSSTKTLSVTLTYPPGTNGKQNRSLIHVVDLREVLPIDVAIGFSSAVRTAAAQPHRVLSWSFSSTLERPAAGSNAVAKRLGWIKWTAIGVGLLLLGMGLACFVAWPVIARTRKKMEDAMAIDLSINSAFDTSGVGPRRFSYARLLRATKNFSEERKLGRGGFGEVYRGVLGKNKMEVAIKRISRTSKQGRKEYVAEVTIISRLRHRNLVQLIGYCHERGDLLLVYEFMANGSLDTHLHYGGQLLAWPERYKIIVGLASALLYLHEEWEQCVVHRDVKPSNVMLDAEFNPKLGDFGLARLVDHGRGSLTTRPSGTRGYMAPEYLTSGKACKESDIYSFGVLTLEVVTGKSPARHEEEVDEADLVEWVWEHYGSGAALAVVDERLEMDFNDERMVRLIAAGLWCAHPDSGQRPGIRQAINVLALDAPLPELPPQKPVATYPQPRAFGFRSSDTTPCNSCSPVSNTAVLGR